jgi:MFS family permease
MNLALYPTLLTIMSFRISSNHKGFYLAIFIAGADFGFAMGAILFGIIAQLISLQGAFIFCTLLLLLTVPCCYYLHKEQTTKVEV